MFIRSAKPQALRVYLLRVLTAKIAFYQRVDKFLSKLQAPSKDYEFQATRGVNGVHFRKKRGHVFWYREPREFAVDIISRNRW